MKFDESAKRLRDALAQKKMSAQELANKSGVNKSSISQYVNGTHMPSNINAGKIGRVLNVAPLYLMCLSDDPTVKETQEHYYLDEQSREMAQWLFDNPEYKVLFDASRNVKPEDIQFVKDFIDRISNK